MPTLFLQFKDLTAEEKEQAARIAFSYAKKFCSDCCDSDEMNEAACDLAQWYDEVEKKRKGVK